MLLLSTDTLEENNPIIIFMHIIALIGIYDVTQEIIEENANILNENMVKKILLFSVLYLKTKSVFISSVCSIVTVLLFHKVFFGPKTSSRTKS